MNLLGDLAVKLKSASREGDGGDHNNGDRGVTVPLGGRRVLGIVLVLLVVGKEESAEDKEKEREKVCPGELAEVAKSVGADKSHFYKNIFFL